MYYGVMEGIARVNCRTVLAEIGHWAVIPSTIHVVRGDRYRQKPQFANSTCLSGDDRAKSAEKLLGRPIQGHKGVSSPETRREDEGGNVEVRWRSG